MVIDLGGYGLEGEEDGLRGDAVTQSAKGAHHYDLHLLGRNNWYAILRTEYFKSHTY